MDVFIGPAGTPLKAKDTFDGLKLLSDMGLNAMEVAFTYSVWMKKNTAVEVGRLARELEIRLSAHAPYFVNLCNPEKREASMKRILSSAEALETMGGTVVVFHPGFYQKLSKEDAYKAVLDACLEMDSIIKENDWKVKLGLETTGKPTQFGTLEENIKISKEVDSAVPVVDWSHIYARNSGKIDYDYIFHKLNEVEIDVIHTHFSGIDFGPKGEKKHIPVEYGSPPLEEFAEKVRESGRNIAIICESPRLEDDALIIKNKITGR